MISQQLYLSYGCHEELIIEGISFYETAYKEIVNLLNASVSSIVKKMRSMKLKISLTCV